MMKDIAYAVAALFIPKTLLFSVLPQSMFVNNILSSMIFSLFVLSSIVAGAFLVWMAVKVAFYALHATFSLTAQIYTLSLKLMTLFTQSLTPPKVSRRSSLQLHIK